MTTSAPIKLLDRSTPPHVSTLILLTGISALNMSIFLPSLNGMTQYFATDYSVMQFAVSGYFLMTAILMLFVGPLSDRYGRRPIVLWFLGMFIAATVAAIFAPNVWIFLFCRMMQASVAACMTISRAVIRDIYPTDQAASKLGYVTMGMAVVPMVGPIIGGALDQIAGWQASFTFLAACAIGIWTLSYFDQGETAKGTGLTFRQQAANYPELFRSVRFWGYVACTTFTAGAYYALLGGASFVASVVFNLTPTQTGIALAAPTTGYLVGNFLSGRYSVRAGINLLILIGCSVTLFGLVVSMILSILDLSSALVFFGLITFMGLGNGLTMPNATAGSLSVRPELAGTASGLGAAIMMGGGAAISAFAGSMLNPDYGELPLSILMVTCGALSLLSILLVMRREATLA
ncbi:Bcr/CflA family drug resistance efflux transporter [Marivivens niveibacter]|uniref:Bcr/CflA family drug resistance efflux transporter n=1 Tax=Marivivens niveibacter TaxID=1930667 RepID=A0A251WYR4_9RHOB|nr:multidrug effflux MFS transporter [Marivivens niveibacter]OUD09204.1 Bcr/CflA family drug resistance efflux transporter [Marivivens niveibacter]